MIINSNDIFSQIGFIVDQKNHNQDISFNSSPHFTTYLEIELGENERHILQVQDKDDPQILAEQFCQEHRLNKLAINLVKKKIIEAKYHEAAKAEKNRQQYQKKNKAPIIQRNVPNRSSSTTPNKVKNKEKQPYDNIYMRGVLKTKIIQEQRAKKKVQIQKQQQGQLTFKPQINNVSQKIVEFLRTSKSPIIKKKPSPKNKFYQEMRQCTFKPKLNKVSERIIHNRSALKEERQQYRMQFQINEQSEEKLAKNKKSQGQKYSFHPQINPKSADKVSLPFFKRNELAIEKRNQMNKSSFYEDQQCSFKPKVGRPPRTREKQNVTVWENLHYNSKKQKGHICATGISKISAQSSHSNYIYGNLIEERIENIFNELDNDQDGLISPNEIGVQKVSQNALNFLKPIFVQMDQIDATLNYNDFKRAVYALMADTDPGTKGAFIAQKWKHQKQEQQTFIPQINKKSKQLSGTRSVQNLYQDGIRDIQAKQYRLQRQRAQKQQKQLSQCSFKPNLNRSSKVYIDKIMKRKVYLNNDRSVSQINNNYQLQQ